MERGRLSKPPVGGSSPSPGAFELLWGPALALALMLRMLIELAAEVIRWALH